MKRQEFFMVFLQRQRRLRVLRIKGPHEQVKGPVCNFTRLCNPDLLQALLHLGLGLLRNVVEQVGSLVDQAAFLTGVYTSSSAAQNLIAPSPMACFLVLMPFLEL